MSEQGTPKTPPGWYPDPTDPARQRYWNGVAWTEHQHPSAAPAQALPTAPAVHPAYAEPAKAPPGTDWNTVWIWLVVLLPLVPTLLLLGVPWDSMFDFDPTPDRAEIMEAMLGIYRSPVYVLASLSGWAVYGLVVFFAYRDYKELAARGVPKPFHWAWAFLTPVYPIGRSVVVARRTGRGYAPMWATIGTIVVSFIVSFVIAGIVMDTMMDLFREMIRRGDTT